MQLYIDFCGEKYSCVDDAIVQFGKELKAAIKAGTIKLDSPKDIKPTVTCPVCQYAANPIVAGGKVGTWCEEHKFIEECSYAVGDAVQALFPSPSNSVIQWQVYTVKGIQFNLGSWYLDIGTRYVVHVSVFKPYVNKPKPVINWEARAKALVNGLYDGAPFWPGDEVTCVDAPPELMLGQKYKVVKVQQGVNVPWYCQFSDYGSAYNCNRFVP